MKKFALTTLTFALASASAHANVPAEHPLTKYLNAPGASVNLPVTAAKQSFDLDFVQGAYDSFESFHVQMGGDHALYYMTNFNYQIRSRAERHSMG